MTVCATRELVPTNELFKKALKEKYAVGAYNVNNMEILQAIVEAADELKAPLILQVSAGARKYANQTYLIKLVEAALNSSTIPIALHLDHGEDFEICKACIDGGFSSVMIDGSKHSLEENIALTKKVVDYAHPKGISVEAELGKLAGVEDNISVSEKDAVYTNPKEAKEFIERTGCDSLAVAIGTSHGAYKFKGEAKLDFERLAAIKEAVGENFPLVLHGSSSVPEYLVKICNDYGAKIPGAKGVPEEMFSKATQLGIAKINIDTDLRLAFTGGIRKHFAEKPSDFDPRQYLSPARAAIKELVKHKIKVLRTDGRA
ncbi:MAG: class II fructose-1,6-bisphosphate aldolase [bacterium]